MPQKQYRHFISLGYFCYVADELERIGLRDTSSPFDWCISDFEGVIIAVENKFADFLADDLLLQNKHIPSHYKNKQYNIEFFHDFNQYSSLAEQLPHVQKKYNRRIERFYQNITEPTLFVRCILDDPKDNSGKSVELKWIEQNYSRITSLLKSFNPENEIVFIADNGVHSQLIKIYNVPLDKNATHHNYKLFEKNEQLNAYLNSFPCQSREKNALIYQKKRRKKTAIVAKIKRKIAVYLKKKALKEYTHKNQYDL